jgi:hypothetical protein
MSITIKQIPPDPTDQLMGLEKEGLSMFPGCESIFEIPLVNGRPNLKFNEDEKKYFENYFKIDFDTPEGQDWLKAYTVKIDHDLTTLDPKNVEHQFVMHILKQNNGMGLIATSPEVIENSAINTFKFIVLDENKETAARVSKKEIKVSAYNKLSELYDSNTLRLVTIAKYIFPANSGIGENKQLAFDKLEEYISQSTQNSEHFNSVCAQDAEYLATVVKIKTAIYKNVIRKGQDGIYYLYSTNTKMGRTEEEVIAFLTNVAHKDLLGYDIEDDLAYSVSAQLKKLNY